MVVAAVVTGTTGDKIGEFGLANEVSAPNGEPVEPKRSGDFVDPGLNRVVSWCLAKSPHRLLGRLVGRNADRMIGNAADAVGTHDSPDGLAKLERCTTRIGSHVVKRSHLHRADAAILIIGDFDVEDPLRPMHITSTHVLKPVFDQLHRHAKVPTQKAN